MMVLPTRAEPQNGRLTLGRPYARELSALAPQLVRKGVDPRVTRR